MPGTCGGLKRSWYGWPAARQIQRPDMRRMSSSPGTSTRIAAATRSPRSASASSSACAWTLVRGKPSRITPCAASVPGEPVQQQADDDLVGHQLARVHVPTGLDPERRAVADGRPEQVAGRDHGDPEAIGEQRRLGALPGAGGAKEDDRVHGTATAAGAAIIG